MLNLLKTGSVNNRLVTSIIKDKMRCLEDFDICNRDDRGMIQEKVMSWQ